MKKYFLVIFQLFICISHLAAQINESTPQSYTSKNKPSVSTFGHYFSAGAGAVLMFDTEGAGINGSYSFTYKSHVLSISGLGSGTLLNGGGSYETWFNYYYYGLLVGEALRFRHWFLSASTGFGHSDVKYYNGTHAYHQEAFVYNREGVSMPAEIKLFFVISHIGFGFQISTDLSAKYTPAIITTNIVFGTWIKRKE